MSIYAAVPAAPAGYGRGAGSDGLGTRAWARGERGREGVDVDYALCLRLQRGRRVGLGA